MHYEADEDGTSARDLARAERKKQAELAKVQRRQERDEAKAEKVATKQREKVEKIAALWQWVGKGGDGKRQDEGARETKDLED